jgi:N-acetylmuramoyl-L-alanine amidase
MGVPYTVRAGDTLTSIARKHSLASWRDIYDAPENATFRRRRPNPDRIFPGDELIIPSRTGVCQVPPVRGGDVAFRVRGTQPVTRPLLSI